MITLIKGIRKQMAALHPDKGGSGDGAEMKRLKVELDSLRKQMRGNEWAW